MRRIALFCIVLLALAVFTVAGAAQEAESAAAAGTAQITAFASNVSGISRDDLANRTARVPVSWTTVNRPLTSNLVFEQMLPGGAVVNVELPRLLPWVPSSGQGLAAPILPSPDATEVVLRVRLVNLFSGAVLSERQLTLPIVSGGTSGSVGDRPTITRFTTTTTYVTADQLTDGSARVPVSWATANRPATSNLVFEQVFADGSTENIELPRDNPFVSSSGNGMVAPLAPSDDSASIRLRVSLFDLVNGRVYDLREIVLPVLPAGTTPTPTPTLTPTPSANYILFYRVNAANVDAAALANGTARLPVTWSVSNRPPNTNLVFEQILANGQVVNVELPRPDPLVASSGNGLIAPVPSGGMTPSIQLSLTLVGLGNGQVYDREILLLPVVTSPAVTPSATVTPPPTSAPTSPPTATVQPFSLTFTTPITGIGRQEILAGGRIQVSWSVSPRPADTNLYFEQVMPDGSAVNVELPRPNPIVPSSGVGAVAPTLPSGVNQIVLRMRLATLTNPTTLAQRELIIPLTGADVTLTPVPVRIDVYTPSTTVLESSDFVNGVVIIPISWNVTNRPNNTNLVFSQVFPDGHSINAELPRPDPLVPSSGTGAVRLQDPGVSVAEVRVLVQLMQLRGSQIFAEREIAIPIAGRVSQTGITPTAETLTAQDSAGTCAQSWFLPELAGCPDDAAQTIVAITQPFEHGVMVLLTDSNQVYFLSNEGTVIAGQPGTYPGVVQPPAGLYTPSAAFQALWGANQERVGWATMPEGSYVATAQHTGDTLYLTLPDGRVGQLTGTPPAAWSAVG